EVAVATINLPDRPNLAHLRHQAADLQRAHAAGDPEAVALVDALSPGTRELSRTGAQLVTARRYGFASWPRLKRHVEVVTEYTRVPDAVPPAADPADEFLRLACLTYSHEDGPDRWRSARRLLAEHPDIPARSPHAAAAVADVERVRNFLQDGDPN